MQQIYTPETKRKYSKIYKTQKCFHKYNIRQNDCPGTSNKHHMDKKDTY